MLKHTECSRPLVVNAQPVSVPCFTSVATYRKPELHRLAKTVSPISSVLYDMRHTIQRISSWNLQFSAETAYVIDDHDDR